MRMADKSCTCLEVFGEDPNCPLHGTDAIVKGLRDFAAGKNDDILVCDAAADLIEDFADKLESNGRHLVAIQKAATAIAYLLNRSRRDEKLYYQIGFGTEAFRLLTDAHAAITGEEVAIVEKRYGA